VEAEFDNGERITADVLIGADGIHSTVRRLLFRPANPHFTGCVAYRGLVPAEALSISISKSARRCGWGQVSISSSITLQRNGW
jgi:2-polyprenyl-6-methoxyphenol hydroxylase-like FAD-dependent oxidoreductase